VIHFTTSDVAQQLNARHLGEPVTFSAVSTDTRTLQAGDLFVALEGPTFDGHDYIGEALQRGAVAAMVSRDTQAGLARILVPDTRIGLGRLAALWRQQSRAPVIAVTGSNGKTTVKEMLAAILRQRASVLATQGNLNNDIGLPLTLMRLQDEQYAVVEMGANHPGEIAYLTGIARPDIALLNNAGRAHLEGFGNLQAVARAKAEILQGLGVDGYFVFNADDAWAPLWKSLAGAHKRRTFGLSRPADVSSVEPAYALSWNERGFMSHFPVKTPDGDIEIELALAGRHNCLNALAAITAAQLVGADLQQIRQGLAALKPVKGRLQPLPGYGRFSVIDDSYNANPDSVGVAIGVLASAPGRRILVLGELAELGAGEASFYAGLGQSARDAGIDLLYGVGAAGLAAEAFGVGGRRFESREALIESLNREVEVGDRVLVKGSRSAGMERVVDALTAAEVH